MGFFGLEEKSRSGDPLKGTSLDFLHKHECRVCPLNQNRDAKSPNMEPSGSAKPLVYMLGEAPDANDDRKDMHFSGAGGRLLHDLIPAKYRDKLRWNHVVRTATPEFRVPTPVEIECCRPSIVRDIEKTRPVAIFGFGNEPLRWATQQHTVSKWTGRAIPVKIGSHTCWFFPMLDPTIHVLQRRHPKFKPGRGRWGSEDEFSFALDLWKAFELVETLPEPVVHTPEDARANVHWVTGKNGWKDVDTVKAVLARMAKADDVIGNDIETNGLRPYDKGAKILTAAVADGKEAFAFALRHRQALWTPEQLEEVEQAYEDFLYDAVGTKAVHSLAFEHEWHGFFYGREVVRAGEWGCSMSQAFILDERTIRSKPGTQSLELLCIQYFGINVKKLSGVDRANLDQVPLEEVLPYNGIDAKYHRNLFMVQERRLVAEDLIRVYDSHMRRVPTMVLTQMKGIPIDQVFVTQLFKKYNERVEEAEDVIFDLDIVRRFKKERGHAFNPGSNEDLKHIFSRMLGVVSENYDEDALGKIDHELAEWIVKYRKASKMVSTYILSVMKGAKETNLYYDDLLHPITNTTSTNTWRTSSDSPNYQNWPKRQKEAKEVRALVKPGGEKRVVSFDYGQIQARNVGMESLDKALVKAFWNRYDIHTDWTERLVHYYPKWVKEGAAKLATDKKLFKAYRDRTKNEMVFPSFFGAVPKSLSNYLEIPVDIAEKLQRDFWDEFPSIKGWQDGLMDSYRKVGYVTGLTGFRRRAPISPNQLINAPIQADEAEIVCTAMAELSEMEIPVAGGKRHKLASKELHLQANMEIHDDLTFIWPKNRVEELAEVVVKTMLNTPFEWAHSVPIVVEMSIGKDWANKEDVGVFESDRWKGVVEVKENLLA